MLNLSKKTAYTLLVFAILVEIVGSSLLEACHAFQDKKLTVIIIICYVIAFTILAKILHLIDLAICYATWSSLGAIGTSLAGIIFFDQELTVIGWISIFAMSFGVFLLNLYGSPEEEEKRKKAAAARKERRA